LSTTTLTIDGLNLEDPATTGG